MKKSIAFLLLALYLCASTEAYQLLKIPAFITHYIQHCNEEPDTTLKSFMAEHYSGTTVYDDDWQQDMELPFKCCECIHMAISPTLTPDPVAIIVPESVEIIISFTPFISTLVPKVQVIKIFQPPRLMT
jgi:hypothetical protein